MDFWWFSFNTYFKYFEGKSRNMFLYIEVLLVAPLNKKKIALCALAYQPLGH
jgi:hypothetical protein